jgi:peptide subunit release factor 1 (eRF1)
MLDKLLGRAALKERIAELEAETDRVQRQLDAESERRSDAVSERQDAQQRANRLEDRIAELEGKIERLEETPAGGPTLRRTETVHGQRLERVLARLESVRADAESALTAYVGDGSDLPDPVRAAFGDRARLVARGAPCLAVADDAELLSATLSVPDPPAAFATWSDRFEIERDWFEPTGTFAFALVRSDLFAMGEYDGRERTALHGFDSELKSKHSKGGYSQARFERLREEQIDDHLDRCRAALDEREADRLYLVGERTVLDSLGDRADVTAAVDATGDPEAALDDAFHEFWTVRLRAV